MNEAVAGKPMPQQILERLEAAFAPTELEVVDEGYKHASHGNAGKGHFHVRIVSAAFAGQLPLKRHRMIYAVMEGLMDNGIHALSIDAEST